MTTPPCSKSPPAADLFAEIRRDCGAVIGQTRAPQLFARSLALVEMLAQERRDVEFVVAVEQRIRLELLSLRQARLLAAPPESRNVQRTVVHHHPHPAHRPVAREHPDLPGLRPPDPIRRAR